MPPQNKMPNFATVEDVVEEFDEETWSASFGAEQYKRR